MYVKPFNEYISLLEKKSNPDNPAQYKAPEGSSRDKKLDKANSARSGFMWQII